MTLLDNDALVEMVESFYGWEQFDLCPDPRVMDALKYVDRKRFLPEKLINLYVIDSEFRNLAYQAAVEMQESGNPVDPRIIQQAFSQVVNSPAYYANVRDLAYNNVVLTIDPTGQTCSQPFVVALFSQLLDAQPGMRVLEVGLGCGYHAAVIGHLIGDNGELVTIERDEELLEMGEKNLRSFLDDSGLRTRVHCKHADGIAGYPDLGKYDRIYFTARAPEGFDLEPVLYQLSPGGKLLLPSTKEGCYGPLLIYDEREGGYLLTEFGNFGFVPLTKGVRLKT